MSIWRWADWIDFVPEHARITLGEGLTPLVRSRRIAPDAHIICMITGSGFKDPHSVEEAVAATAGAPLVSLEEFAKLGS